MWRITRRLAQSGANPRAAVHQQPRHVAGSGQGNRRHSLDCDHLPWQHNKACAWGPRTMVQPEQRTEPGGPCMHKHRNAVFVFACERRARAARCSGDETCDLRSPALDAAGSVNDALPVVTSDPVGMQHSQGISSRCAPGRPRSCGLPASGRVGASAAAATRRRTTRALP